MRGDRRSSGGLLRADIPDDGRRYGLNALWILDLPTYEAGAATCPRCAAGDADLRPGQHRDGPSACPPAGPAPHRDCAAVALGDSPPGPGPGVRRPAPRRRLTASSSRSMPPASTDVRGFTLRTSAGRHSPYQLGDLENPTEFSPSHLKEHQATSAPDPRLVPVRERRPRRLPPRGRLGDAREDLTRPDPWSGATGCEAPGTRRRRSLDARAYPRPRS